MFKFGDHSISEKKRSETMPPPKNNKNNKKGKGKKKPQKVKAFHPHSEFKAISFFFFFS
jgi:hypothetical protein